MSLFSAAAKIQSIVMKWRGILPFEKYPRLQPFMLLITYTLLFSFLKTLWDQKDNLETTALKISFFPFAGSTIMTMGRLFVMRLRIKRILKLFDQLDGISFAMDFPEGKRIYEKTIRRAQWYTRCISGIYFILMFEPILRPLIVSGVNLPMEVWYPVKIDLESNSRLYLYLRQTIEAFNNVLAVFLVDSLPVIILFAIDGQLECLGYRLKNLPISPVGLWNEKLGECSVDYLKIVRACRSFEDIFTSSYLLQMGLQVVNLGTLIFGLHSFFYFVGMITLTLQLYLPCKLGSMIQSRSDNLRFKLYSSQWYRLDPLESKKGLHIFMEIFQKPVIITFGKIFILNLETFASIINIVYKLYALMLDVI